MSTRHTPGIWALDSDPDERLYVAQEYRGKPGGRICEVFRNCLVDDYKQRANARLIAAAPDLLEALIAMNDYVSDPVRFSGSADDVFNKASAAIAKATGEKA